MAQNTTTGTLGEEEGGVEEEGGFDSVVFESMTREAKLKQIHQMEIRRSGLRLRVIERTGKTMKNLTTDPEPFQTWTLYRN